MASAPAMPPRKPIVALCVSCAARTADIADASIIPSMPRLIMPARCTMSSPSTASSSGVAATMAMASISIMSAEAPEEDEREDDDGLAERRHARGDAGRALQLARTGDERAEERRGEDRGQRMQVRQQRDRDAGVAVAGRESLEQPMRDAEEL